MGKREGTSRVAGRLRKRLVVALDNAALDVVVGDPVLVGHRSDLSDHHWRLVRIQACAWGCMPGEQGLALRLPARAGT